MKNLTDKELEVMRVLWQFGQLKPSEIQEHLGQDVGNAALRSMLVVLLEKGHLIREKVGKAYFYQATTSQKGVLKGMIRQVLDVFCEGSPGRLMAHLAKSEKLSDEDVAELRKVLSSKGRKPKS